MQFSEHLRKNRDFQFVYQNGKSFGNRLLVVYRLANGTDKNRLGISVSKKVGNSVIRHRVTRLIRESYRLKEEKFVRGYDIVVIARPGAKESNFFDIQSALLHAARKQKLLHAVKNEQFVSAEKEVNRKIEKNTD